MFTEKNTLNFIDLFSGAGGLSEGFFNHSFNPIAHVEMNTYASETLKTRSCYYYLKKTKQLDVYRDYLKGTITKEGNIRCIEIAICPWHLHCLRVLNSNIRCIEITNGINISNKHTVE